MAEKMYVQLGEYKFQLRGQDSFSQYNILVVDTDTCAVANEPALGDVSMGCIYNFNLLVCVTDDGLEYKVTEIKADWQCAYEIKEFIKCDGLHVQALLYINRLIPWQGQEVGVGERFWVGLQIDEACKRAVYEHMKATDYTQQ